MALPSSSSSLTYDVFLSFRGEDTRWGFSGNLYKALHSRGIHTFFDDEDLRNGEEITPALMKAIEKSRIAIVVLSINYASSSFCLEELAYILDLSRKGGLLVLPILYMVDPSDVRYQRGSCGEALATQHGLKHSPKKLQKWELALCDVTYLSGYHYHFHHGYEYEFIKRIVELVSSTINRTSLHVVDYPVRLKSPSNVFSHDVFLSFRGEDTRYGFTGWLYKTLLDRGINTFMDDEGRQIREEITPALVKTIEQSEIAIIVLSEHYAASSFCLDELVTILHCRQRKGLSVVPVFYNVDPSDVRHQRGSYGEALSKHEERLKHNMYKLGNWKMALRQVTTLVGFCFPHGYEYEFIKRIVELVSSTINRTSLHVVDYPVRLKSPSNVFLSFRGEDTRYGFTGWLYKTLLDRGINTFMDDEGRQIREEITPALVKTIEQSEIAIIVLSEHYAASSFCLDELVTILHCRQSEGLSVVPVFYNVDPSDVRQALSKHEERLKHNMDKLENWKMALRQVASLSGFHFKYGQGYEYKFIEEIVREVSLRISSPHYPGPGLGSHHYSGGLSSQVLEVMELLDVGSHDSVHIIGIHGIDGVGKSTLVRAVYNNLTPHRFDALCFIENVREKSKKHGLQHLQIVLLSNILGVKDINLTSVQQGISMIKHSVQRKKVLLILDDVDKDEQLQALGIFDWFGHDSRVIITTQDKQMLASHGVKIKYEVNGLNKNKALQLLTWKAFKTEYYDPRYKELLNLVVTYASGLPLALEIIGSNLFGKSVEEWESVIRQIEKSGNNPIQAIFKASFNALEEKERSVFLDIACCFKGYELAEVQHILQAHYGYCVNDHIDVLVEKSLVKLSYATKPCYNRITLHGLIEDMGKEIERQESLTKQGERKRLWLPEDIREVLGHDKGTSQIEIICLDLPIFDEEEMVEWDGKAFQNMQNLKTLIIKNGNFSKGPEYLPSSLRVLEWWRYPSHCLPSDFHPNDLVICKLPYSHISKVELTGLLKKYVNLRVLDFSSANV